MASQYDLFRLLDRFEELSRPPSALEPSDPANRVANMGLPPEAVSITWWTKELKSAALAFATKGNPGFISRSEAGGLVAEQRLDLDSKLHAARARIAELEAALHRVESVPLPRPGRGAKVECDHGWDD